MSTFKALVIREGEGKQFTRSIEQRDIDDLPQGDVVVRVLYSSLNYKDALSATGNKGVTRSFPHTPGIDAAGTVHSSSDQRFKVGDKVIVTSYDFGMNTSGGFGEYIRVPADWVVALPEGMSLKDSMAYGTAGLTAAMSVDALIHGGVTPESGDVLVSGATGGVGSVAVAILAKLGYRVTAVSGKADQADYLKSIGAETLISRDEVIDASGRPMLKTRWAGCVDTVGGDILSSAIKATSPNGVVTSCGNAAGPNLDLTVFPFILRGVSLVGIDSQNFPMKRRERVWNKLATEWKVDSMDSVVNEIRLDELSRKIDDMLAASHKGRTVINLQ